MTAHKKKKLSEHVWWDYISDDLKGQFLTSEHLIRVSQIWSETVSDYSFIIFPSAKAYEGVLKKVFFDLGFLSKTEYQGSHFRIGKSLNPKLEMHLRGNDWVYPKLLDYCHDAKLPDTLWNTWRECRNTVFHWFPGESSNTSFEEACRKVEMIISSIDLLFEECNIDVGGVS